MIRQDLETVPVSKLGITAEELRYEHDTARAGATCEAVSAVVWAVRAHWGEHGYTLRQIGGGLFGVTHFDGSRCYLWADRYGNVREVRAE